MGSARHRPRDSAPDQRRDRPRTGKAPLTDQRGTAKGRGPGPARPGHGPARHRRGTGAGRVQGPVTDRRGTGQDTRPRTGKAPVTERRGTGHGTRRRTGKGPVTDWQGTDHGLARQPAKRPAKGGRASRPRPFKEPVKHRRWRGRARGPRSRWERPCARQLAATGTKRAQGRWGLRTGQTSRDARGGEAVVSPVRPGFPVSIPPATRSASMGKKRATNRARMGDRAEKNRQRPGSEPRSELGPGGGPANGQGWRNAGAAPGETDGDLVGDRPGGNRHRPFKKDAFGAPSSAASLPANRRANTTVPPKDLVKERREGSSSRVGYEQGTGSEGHGVLGRARETPRVDPVSAPGSTTAHRLSPSPTVDCNPRTRRSPPARPTSNSWARTCEPPEPARPRPGGRTRDPTGQPEAWRRSTWRPPPSR